MLAGCVSSLMFIITTCGTFQQSTTVCSGVISLVSPSPTAVNALHLCNPYLLEVRCVSTSAALYSFSYMDSLLTVEICRKCCLKCFAGGANDGNSSKRIDKDLCDMFSEIYLRPGFDFCINTEIWYQFQEL